MEDLLSQAGIARYQAMRAAEAEANPASRQQVDAMLRCLKTATGRPGSAKLQKRVLEMLRLQEEVVLGPPLQPAYIQAGDTMVELPVELDVMLVACSSSCGQRHLGIQGKAQPLHWSLRRGALAAIAEMSNYGPIVDAVCDDVRIFKPSWLPSRLQQVMTQCKYGLTVGQVAAQREQVHAIAERLLYLCANCSPAFPLVKALNAHCSLHVVRCFHDQWQCKHEPLESDASSSRSSSSSSASQPRQAPRHSIPANMRIIGPMKEMAHRMSAMQAESDMMSCSFGRYLTHCVQVTTEQQKLAWNEAGAIAKIQCVAAHTTGPLHVDPDMVLQHLQPAWNLRARQQSLEHTRDVTAVAQVKAEQMRLAGNAAYKAGQLQEALQHYTAAAWVHPSDPLLYNNSSLVQLKLGHVTEAYSAVLAALGHCPGNAKAWLRLAEACKAAGRWQLAQLYYSMAVEELGVTDVAAQQSMLESRAHLSRVWRWAEVPVAWQLDALAKWLRMPAKPNTEAGIAAWSQQLNDDWFRLSTFNSSRAMAVAHKNEVLAAQALRAAEAGQLRRLPLSGHTWRLSWRQMDIRGLSSGHAKYEISLVLESTTWELTTLVEGQPCAADLLALTALQCWAPVQAGARHRPKQLLLAARCKALFAELQDAVFGRWGIPLQLQSELEALRAAKEGGEHYLGLQLSYLARRSAEYSGSEALQDFQSRT
uniref:C2H2-type domain-containing protein n=1 Tax=Tetradesmus obliquus TaxID=3088 RepID=A0A383WI69_TETOB|eukprot:jgi/Sobl393_1/1267/SZX77175.1